MKWYCQYVFLGATNNYKCAIQRLMGGTFTAAVDDIVKLPPVDCLQEPREASVWRQRRVWDCGRGCRTYCSRAQGDPESCLE